jgi:hypothetical protein
MRRFVPAADSLDSTTKDAESATVINLNDAAPQPLPIVMLPGGVRTINAAAAELGALFAEARTLFNRGGAVVYVERDDMGRPKLEELRPTKFASDLESVATLVELDVKGAQQRTICHEAKAKLLLHSASFRDSIPAIRVLSRCPVLVERDGVLIEIAGFDQESGILAEGQPAENVPLDEAIELLTELLSEFQFTSLGDRSRALAALITPALVMGGLLPGRAALDLGEADDSQAGKGFRHKLTAAIYNDTVHGVCQPGKGKGVGSLEEAFDSVLVAGRCFISFDNVRGKIDSPKIESFLTEDTYYARCAYHKNTSIDPRRVYVMFTSNKADITRDLANRSSCVRIQKREGYEFRRYPEGNILDRVRAQQPRHLGAVFAVVKQWYSQGKPKTDDTRHDFRGWAQTMDWIVQNIFGVAPLLDGLRETQDRMTNPTLNWLRDVMLVLFKQQKQGQWIQATDIMEALDEDGEVEIPGLRDGRDITDAATRQNVLQQIGRRLKRCFGSDENDVVIELDGMRMVRESYTDAEGRAAKRYFVAPAGDAPPEVPF